jgi:HAD superfamily hydrolase (TIGR01509 family)
MNIVIPLGGKGERFIKEGYNTPKALINILDKTMIEYVLDNLNYNKNDKIYIIYNEKLDGHNFSSIIKKKYPYINLFSIDDTKGAVETLYKGFKFIVETKIYHEKTLLLDCDTFYTEDLINKFRNSQNNACFFTKNYETNPIYSYINIDEQNKITDIKEKEKISDNANTGCYAFQNIHELNKYCKYVLENNITFNNEPYTSCVIAEMIKNNIKFDGIELQEPTCFSLGTPLAVKKYIDNVYGFLFDLDGTLVLTDKIYFNVWKEILNNYNIDISEDLFKNYIQGNNDEYVNNTLLKNINIDTKEISKLKDELFIKNIDKIILIKGVKQFLEEIRYGGHKICIVTNCNKIVAEHIIKYVGINKYIDFIISNNDVVNGKPHKEPYFKAMQKYNLENDKCFIFEDSKSGILSAKQNKSRMLIGIETIYDATEMQQYNVDISIQDYNNFNLIKLFENNKDSNNILKNQISKTMQCNENDIILENMLKGGFIADVNAFQVRTNNKMHNYIVKYENNKQENDLSIMAKKIQLYEREYYFYEFISKHLSNIKLPSYYGLVKDNNNNNIGIILENLFSKNLIPNIKLNITNIDISLKIIDNMILMHSQFWNKNIHNKFTELKKTDSEIFQPFYENFIQSKYDIFINKWNNVLNNKQLDICKDIFSRFKDIQNNLSRGENLTFIHGDIKSPNLFYDTMNNFEPYFVDWQHCGIGKGVQDLVFFIVESFNIEHLDIVYDLFINYYYVKLQENNIVFYDYNEYKQDLKDALCYVPYFTCMWFGTIPQDELIDKNFPYFLITKLFYLLEKIYYQ